MAREINLDRDAYDGPGRHAESPGEIPKRGWFAIAKRTGAQIKNDHVPLLSAGVAFYALLALFPALIAAVTVYGLIADPQQAAQQIQSFTNGLGAAGELIQQQLTSIVNSTSSALGWGLIVSLAGLLWAMSSGMQNLIKAVNIAYDEPETRGFFKLRGIALVMSIGALVFFLAALALVAAVPPLLSALNLGTVGTVLAQIVRWVLLAAIVAAALAAVYRIAPARDDAEWRWVTPGAAVATVLWLIGSALFSFYVNNFSSYNETYGALAGVIVLMLWLALTSFVVLLGAEIDAEMELQTVEDTTVGEERPLGERNAVKADRVPETSDAGASKPG